MLNATEYQALRAKIDAHEKWLDGRTSYRVDECPPEYRVSNDERSSVEVYEFVNNPPKRYTAYLKIEDKSGLTHFQATAGMLDSFTTWTGERLGSLNVWKKTRDGRGNKVWYVVAHGINGLSYYGRHYPDSGDIVYLTAHKNQK